MAALSPHGRWFYHQETDGWIFRGVADASWDLVPSAFLAQLQRPRITGQSPRPMRPSERTNHVQIAYELRHLRCFFDHADRTGLPLPEDGQTTRETLERFEQVIRAQSDGDGTDIWPPRSIWSLLAIAQHHRVSTRLLDWSWSSHIAAYFAAVDAPRQPQSRDIAVWAYRVDLHSDDAAAARSIAKQIKIVKSPYAANRNLAAQLGVHLLHEPEKNDGRAPLNVRSIHDALVHIHDAYRREYEVDGLIKFTVPKTQARDVLDLLRKEHITAASLYPGFDGAARAVREELYWEYPASSHTA